jgi:hypothetical protein
MSKNKGKIKNNRYDKDDLIFSRATSALYDTYIISNKNKNCKNIDSKENISEYNDDSDGSVSTFEHTNGERTNGAVSTFERTSGDVSTVGSALQAVCTHSPVAHLLKLLCGVSHMLQDKRYDCIYKCISV